MKKLLTEIRNCKHCEEHLVLGANPVVSLSPESKLLIIGQAPGKIVHNTGIPWNDKSGDNLRDWLDVPKEVFYNENEIALLPIGFCYPGKGKSGDLPPRTECAPLWHSRILKKLTNVQLILLVGQYAQNYYLGQSIQETLTKTVRNYKQYLPDFFPLPHPSPRNNIWQTKNQWFKSEVLPELKKKSKEGSFLNNIISDIY